MMRRVILLLAVLAAVGSLAGAQAPQGQQSQGALGQRPGADRQPEFPVPGIRDYKPRSTLVVPQHPVPRARFPVIDIHSHQPSPIPAAQFEMLVRSMDPLNLRLLVNASGESGEPLRQAVAAIRGSPHRERMVMFADIDFRNVGPGFGRKAAGQLEADVKAGALGLGEISKEAGMTYKKTDGTRLRIDDPELDPIWDTAGRLDIPVFIHTAEPQEFFEPIDYSNELELARIIFGKDSYQPDQFPYFWRTFETSDEYFDYYRDYHAFWKLYGMGLPDGVLRKLYYQNALKVVPGLPRAGFTD